MPFNQDTQTALPVSPIRSPQAWRGFELAGDASWIRVFSESEINELESAARQALLSGKTTDDLSRQDFALPTLGNTCREWLQELDRGRGFILLRGLPVESWGRDISELAYLGLGLQMGGLASQNAAGDLMGHIRDTGENPDDPAVRLYKTRRAQGFHTDGADVIGLLCLQSARDGGESRIVSSVSVFNHILETRPDLVPLMFQPFHFDRNDEQAEGEDPTFAIPLAYYDSGKLRMFYIGWYIRDAQRHPSVPRLTAEQVELLDLIESTADQLALDMDFQPGDIQLLKNSTILHGRGAYEDWDDVARKRHLLRLWINADDVFEDQGNVVKAVPTKRGVTSDANLLSER